MGKKEKNNKKQKKKRVVDKQVVFNRAVPINILGIILCALIYTIGFLIYRGKYKLTDSIADISIYFLLICNPILYYDYKRADPAAHISAKEQKKKDGIFITTIIISELIYIVKIIIQLLMKFNII